MFFRRPRITADYEVDEAASGAGSPILSKTCRGHIALDEMLFDQYFVSALSFQQVICIGTCPHGAFRSHDSCPWRKGQPQTPYQTEFSVRIAHLRVKSEIVCKNSLGNVMLQGMSLHPLFIQKHARRKLSRVRSTSLEVPLTASDRRATKRQAVPAP